MKKTFTFLLLFAFPFIGQTQVLHSVEFLNSATAAELQAQLNMETTNGVEFFRVLYYTKGSDGLPDTASGLFVIPDLVDASLPLTIYHHGTSAAKNLTPSNLNLDYDAYTGIAASGFITIAPDFLGMGNSRGFHPYVHRETQASASIDLLNAFVEWSESNSVAWNGQLFLTGYSQGGHASMATHLELESNPEHGFDPTAAAHLSGPYSISEVMLDLMFSERDYLTVGFIPYVILGYQEVYGDLYDDLSDILRQGFIAGAMDFYNGAIDLNQLTFSMVVRLGLQFGNIHPVNVFNPQFIDNMRNNPDYHVPDILKDNDVYDWVPVAPTRLFYCSGDETVPHENSLVADSVMNANGANDVLRVDLGANLGHGPCARPAILASIDFFNSFLVSSIEEIAHSSSGLSLYPNPANWTLQIEPAAGEELMEIEIINISGQLLGSIYGTKQLDLSNLREGQYLLRIRTNQGLYTERLSIVR